MGIKVFGDARDTQDIVVVDANMQVLTSLQRQESIFASGCRFDAAISQAAMVEGLLLHYLLCAKQIRNVVFDGKTEQRLARERITFGQVKDALKKASAFHDQELEVDVDAYVGQRNRIAHHVAASLQDFDLQAFFDAGSAVALRLWKHILDETAPHRHANP